MARPHSAISGGGAAYVVAFRRQDRQVIDGEHPAARGTIVQVPRDRREVAAELCEALIGRLPIPEVGDAGPDGWQRPQRPGQAGQEEARDVTDIVAARSDGHQSSGRGDRVELAGWPAAERCRMSAVVAPE